MLMSMIKAKARLWIEYGMIGTIVVMGGFVVTLWLQKKTMEVTVANLGAEITAINIVNQKQENTITNLLNYREEDAKAIQGLLESEHLSRRANLVLEDKLRDLEKQNEVVRNFLDMPIPPELCPIARHCDPIRSEDGGGKGSAASNPN